MNEAIRLKETWEKQKTTQNIWHLRKHNNSFFSSSVDKLFIQEFKHAGSSNQIIYKLMLGPFFVLTTTIIVKTHLHLLQSVVFPANVKVKFLFNDVQLSTLSSAAVDRPAE